MNSPRKPPEPLRYPLYEACRVISMPYETLRRRIRAGKIQAHRDGTRVYVTRAELERYVTACQEDAR